MSYLKLTKKLRKKLKKPLNEVTSFDEILKSGKIIDKIIICVGDKTSELALSRGIDVKICIYDSLIKRKKIKISDAVKNFAAREVNLKNPAGYLNLEVFDIIISAIDGKDNVKIIVDGEEDLITLAAISVAPKDSIILYGQPNEGLVMVEVDTKVKAKIEKILERMEKVEEQIEYNINQI